MKTIIYIKVIIYGSQAPFRVNITECFKTFMNQAWHHRRAENYYLYVAEESSKVKLSKLPSITQRWSRSQAAGAAAIDMCGVCTYAKRYRLSL